MNKTGTTGLLLVLLLQVFVLHGQGENNNWCFGRFSGLDFNNTPPTLFQHNMLTIEGCATVSDASGNLLFYSSGNTVWDRNGNTMPNGTGMQGNGPFMPPPINGMIGSSIQGVAVARSPENPDQYYIFTTNAVDESNNNVYYSVVDMSLNGGLGDVITTQRDILLASDVVEGVLILKDKACGYWIIVHKKTGNNYLAFRLDNAGVHTTPVISAGLTGNNTSWGNMGYMDYSYVHNLLVRGIDTIELLSFNTATGQLNLNGYLKPGDRANGVLFSPDDSKLYVSTNSKLVQFNTALLPNIAAVQSSIQLIDSGLAFGMRNGPDGKLYLLRTLQNWIAVAHNPNAAGTACNYVRNAIAIPQGNGWLTTEFGRDLAVAAPSDTVVRATRDTLVCQSDSLVLRAPDQSTGYRWSNGATTRETTVRNDDTYWVTGITGCTLYIDSIKVRFVSFSVRLGNDTLLCPGDQLQLDASLPGASYRWQDGSTAPTFTAQGKGRYYVTVSLASCSQSDTIWIDEISPFIDLLENDTTLCNNERLRLHARAAPESSYRWNDGSTGPEKEINAAGVYTVTAENVCGTFSDSVRIETRYCSCKAYAPNAFSPNGDGKNDRFVIELYCPDAMGYRHYIYNRFGQRVFESQQQGQFWDGNFGGRPCDAGTYFYYIEYKNGNEKVLKKGDLVLVR